MNNGNFFSRLHPLEQLRQEMNRALGDSFGGLPRTAVQNMPLVGARVFPSLNMWTTSEAVFAEAELPGLRESDVDVSVFGNELTISGQRPELEQQDVRFHRRERGVGSFSRTVRLPVDVDPDRVEATLRDGVLQIKLPKAEAARPRKINVQASA